MMRDVSYQQSVQRYIAIGTNFIAIPEKHAHNIPPCSDILTIENIS